LRHLRGCKLGEVHEGPCAVPLEGYGFDLVMYPGEADDIVAKADRWDSEADLEERAVEDPPTPIPADWVRLKVQGGDWDPKPRRRH
jgi:hypothetical protein